MTRGGTASGRTDDAHDARARQNADRWIYLVISASGHQERMGRADVWSTWDDIRQNKASFVESAQRQQPSKLSDIGSDTPRRSQLGSQRVPFARQQGDRLDGNGVACEGVVEL